MYNYFVYQQPFVVLGSTSGPLRYVAPPSVFVDASPETTSLIASPETTSLIIETTFLSVPVITRTELMQDYQELGQALSEMTEFSNSKWGVPR